MRTGFLVKRGSVPVEGAEIRATLPFGLTTGFPFVPTAGVTDAAGEWFGVVPLAVSPANYFMDVAVVEGADQVNIRGLFDGVENVFVVDMAVVNGLETSSASGSRETVTGNRVKVC